MKKTRIAPRAMDTGYLFSENRKAIQNAEAEVRIGTNGYRWSNRIAKLPSSLGTIVNCQ